MEYTNDKFFIVNPVYNIKSDEKRIILYNSVLDSGARIEMEDVLTFLHPLYAAILALFDGRNSLGKIAQIMEKLFKLSEFEIKKIIKPLLCNEKKLECEWDGYSFFLPSRLIIEKNTNVGVRDFSLKDFIIPGDELDLVSKRLYRPLDAAFMVNTICRTDCVYCYAKRTSEICSRFTIQRIKKVIQEAKEIGIRSFDITGGEVFLYPYWQELIEEFLGNGFYPFLSTKMPIDITVQKILKDIGIKRIQISLDSIFPHELQKILSVGEDYFPQIMHTLKSLDRLGFDIYINSQITRFNCDHVEKLLIFLSRFENIRRINIGAAGFSMYCRCKCSDYLISLESANKIESIVNNMKKNVPEKLHVNFSGYLESSNFIRDNKDETFQKRAQCSGNFNSFYILPDGRVTVCEELYDHPSFIIGDLTRQSIMEMWNSTQAMELYKLKKERIRSESACSSCEDFDSCHQTKGVCWKFVLYAYGENNWDYPDPRCSQAPHPKREFYLK